MELLVFYLFNITEVISRPRKADDGRMFVCVEILRPSQPNGVMSSVVSLPNHRFTGQA